MAARLQTHLQAEICDLREKKKTNHPTCLLMGALLLWSVVVLLLFTSLPTSSNLRTTINLSQMRFKKKCQKQTIPRKFPACHSHTIVRFFLMLPTSETQCIFLFHQSVKINQECHEGEKNGLVEIHGKCPSLHFAHVRNILLPLFSLTSHL